MEAYENNARTARNVTVVVGATVATGGVAGLATTAGYGVVATGVVATAAGTTAGTVIGATSSAVEQTGHVSRGNKSAAQAVSLGRRALNGAAAGASGSAVATTANEAIDVGTGKKEFKAGQFTEDLIKNTAAGSLGGAIGGTGSAFRTGTSAVKSAAIPVAEGTADVAVGVAIEAVDAAKDGRKFSVDEAKRAVTESIRGTLIGELSGTETKSGSLATRGVEAALKDASSNPDYKLPDKVKNLARQGKLQPEDVIIALDLGAVTLVLLRYSRLLNQ